MSRWRLFFLLALVAVVLIGCGAGGEEGDAAPILVSKGDHRETRALGGTELSPRTSGRFLQDRGGPARQGVTPGPAPNLPLSPFWQRADQGVIRATALAEEDRVFVLSSQGELVCLDRETGNPLWTLALSPPALGSPVLDEGRIHVLDGGGRLLALSAEGGQELWREEIGEGTSIPLFLMDGVLLVAGNRGKIWALRAADGQALWDKDLKTSLYGAVSGRGGQVFLGSESGLALALALEDGRELWKSSLPGSVLGPLIPVEEAVFGVLAGPKEGGYFCMDPDSGELRWNWPLATEVIAPAVVEKGWAYFADSAGNVFSVQLDTGIIRWRKKLYDAVSLGPLMVDGKIFVTTEDSLLYSLEGASGEIRGRAVLPEGVAAPPLILDGMVYLASLHRGLYALQGATEEEAYSPIELGPVFPPILDPQQDLEVFLPPQGLRIHLPPLKGLHYLGLVEEGPRPVTLKLLDQEGSELAENLGYTQLEMGFDFRFDEKKRYFLQAAPVQLAEGLIPVRLRLQSARGSSEPKTTEKTGLP